MEYKLLAALISDRTGFNRLDDHISEKDVSPEGAVVLRHIRDFYYKDNNAKHVDMDILKENVISSLNNNKHEQLFDLYFQSLKEQDVSAVNVIDTALGNKRRALEASLIEAIGAKDSTAVDSLMEQILSLSEAFEENEEIEEYAAINVKELSTAFEASNCIQLSPPSLNRRTGGRVMRGHHIIVVAYPEVGKTAIGTTLLAGFVRQGLRTLYIGNEDPILSIIVRSVASITGMTIEAVTNHPERADALARDRGYDNAIFVGLPGGTAKDLTAMCEKYKPDVLIVDQIRNITSSAENRTIELERIARHMRNLGRRYNLLAVSITQGADSARDKLYLDMGDVDGSNVGIPGTADMMIMAGMTPDFDTNNRRMLTLAKNKIGGIRESWPVCINKQRSRIYDPV